MDLKPKKRHPLFGSIAVLLAALAAFIFLMALSLRQRQATQSDAEALPADAHYCFIAENMTDRRWQLLYEATRSAGEADGVYVECLNQDLPDEYRREDLLKVAILAEADGIFLEGGESEELSALVTSAGEAGIPVITLERDCISSGRRCFIETGNYNLGREYARQIIGVATKETQTVLIVMQEDDPVGNATLLSGLRNTLANEGNHLQLDIQEETVSEGTFTSAQLIRRRVLSVEKTPDIIICCTDQDTVNAHQVLVDYNLLDQIRLIGASTSSTILRAIENGSLYASVVTDFSEMGERCIETMRKIRDGETPAEHYGLDAGVIRRENVRRYLGDE